MAMINRILFSIFFLMFSAEVQAQIGPSGPTDLQEQTARAIAAEKQNEYLMIHIQRSQALNAQRAQNDAENAKKTADWWAEVWKALPPKDETK